MLSLLSKIFTYRLIFKRIIQKFLKDLFLKIIETKNNIKNKGINNKIGKLEWFNLTLKFRKESYKKLKTINSYGLNSTLIKSLFNQKDPILNQFLEMTLV